MGRAQRIPNGEANWRGHFENTLRVPSVHQKRFGIDNNGAVIWRGNIYSCIIIYARCRDMCSSCVVDYFRCANS